MNAEQIAAQIADRARLTTSYAIARKIAPTRPATAITSKINRAIDDPRKCRLETVVEIVEALGGEVSIKWKSQKLP